MEIRIETNPKLTDLLNVVKYVKRNLAVGAFPKIATNKPFLPLDAKEWFEKYKDGRQLYAIAYLNKQVVGVAHIDVERGRRKHCGKLAVTVDHAFRKKGVATALLIDLAKQCKAIGIINIRAEPTEDNNPIISLLEKLEYNVEGKQNRAFLSDEGNYLDIIELTLYL